MRNEDVARIENAAAKADVFDVRWRVTTLCNYQCAFCIQGNKEAHARAAKGESAKTRNAICDALVNLIESLKGYRSVSISLIGGEVTILPDFESILGRLAACSFAGSITFHITTNLSQSAEYYNRLIDIVRECNRPNATRRLHISASFYQEYATEKQFSDKLLPIAKHAADDNARNPQSLAYAALRRWARWGRTVHAGYPIITDEDYAAYKRMRSQLGKAGVGVSPIIIREYDTSLSQRTLKSLLHARMQRKVIVVTDTAGKKERYPNIQALGVALEDTERFNPRGYVCDAGIHNIWVNAFGDVHRCPALHNTMYIGNLLDGSFSPLSYPAPCTADHCSCNQYGLIEQPGA